LALWSHHDVTWNKNNFLPDLWIFIFVPIIPNPINPTTSERKSQATPTQRLPPTPLGGFNQAKVSKNSMVSLPGKFSLEGFELESSLTPGEK